MFKTAKYSVARSTQRLELFLTVVLTAACLGLVAFSLPAGAACWRSLAFARVFSQFCA
jgi:hypothetical protein